MRIAVKNPLLVGALLAAVLPLIVCSVPWAHTTLEAFLDLHPWAHMTLEISLNVLWLLLAVAAFLGWVGRKGERRYGRVHGLVNLVFLFCLLFPVISANDDLAQIDLINDPHFSRSIGAALDHHKQLLSSAAQPGSPTTLLTPCDCSPPVTSDFIPEAAPMAAVAAPGDSTGNHSPPLC